MNNQELIQEKLKEEYEKNLEKLIELFKEKEKYIYSKEDLKKVKKSSNIFYASLIPALAATTFFAPSIFLPTLFLGILSSVPLSYGINYITEKINNKIHNKENVGMFTSAKTKKKNLNLKLECEYEIEKLKLQNKIIEKSLEFNKENINTKDINEKTNDEVLNIIAIKNTIDNIKNYIYPNDDIFYIIMKNTWGQFASGFCIAPFAAMSNIELDTALITTIGSGTLTSALSLMLETYFISFGRPESLKETDKVDAIKKLYEKNIGDLDKLKDKNSISELNLLISTNILNVYNKEDIPTIKISDISFSDYNENKLEKHIKDELKKAKETLNAKINKTLDEIIESEGVKKLEDTRNEISKMSKTDNTTKAKEENLSKRKIDAYYELKDLIVNSNLENKKELEEAKKKVLKYKGV